MSPTYHALLYLESPLYRDRVGDPDIEVAVVVVA
jgi:hypothetical protein